MRLRSNKGTVDDLAQRYMEVCDENERLRAALTAWKRFAKHAEERKFTVPLWGAVLWDEAVAKSEDASW